MNALDTKIDIIEQRLGGKIDELGEKVDAVRDRVSRIEGQLTPTKLVYWESETTKPKMAKKA